MEDSEDHQHQSEADIYKRVRVLGSGSYGRAFLVQEKQTGEELVIKQINLADMAPEEQQAALKEAKILEMLNHQNIICFRQVYRTAKMKLNIVMQYAGGGDLSQRIKSAKQSKMHFSEGQILKWFVQICLAVRYIHSNKIIHRDLKAQNIFLTPDGLVKLGDFGVAKVLQHTASKARTVVGSPYYLSPEIIENKPYSFKTDIWSLGTLLFELCALQPPFKANNLQFLALKIVQGTLPQLPKMYSEGLRNLVRSMLQTKESHRPSIHQIFSQKIILDMITKLNTTPQVHHHHPHPITNCPKMNTLKPPPNLLTVAMVENKSDIVLSKRLKSDEQESPPQTKAQTPLMNVRKGANHFFHPRPVSGKRKVERNSRDLDLSDLIQIKPSIIEKHEKHQKPQIPLPPIPKVPSSKGGVLPSKPTIEIKKPEKKDTESIPSTAFTKKRSSFAHFEVGKIQINKNQQLLVIKPEHKEKQEPKKEKYQKKPQIRKKNYGTVKKQISVTKLEIYSQQMKRKQGSSKNIQKKKSQKVIKKNQKSKKQRKAPPTRQQSESPIMEQQKCNSEHDLISYNESDNYCISVYDQDFESYSDDSEEVELAFSITNKGNLNDHFQKMRMELKQIQKIVQSGQDIQNAQLIAASIPELINFSSLIREDDHELDSNHQTNLPKQALLLSQINLECLESHSELEALRIKLQDILGVDNLIFSYRIIEQKLDEEGLNFSQNQVIKEILLQRTEINQPSLCRYFGHIVAIISRQKNLL